MADEHLEPGSFRDREATVFYRDGAVLRGLSPAARADWDALAATAFFPRLVAAGAIIGTEEVAVPDGSAFAAVLRHERIPFVSYPYEWTFGMLQDAALLQLELVRQALDEGLLLKDASPFNVQWRGSRPVFIDIPSFTRARPGDLWAGYRQFCQAFLYPLLLQAYRGVPFHPWLRGALEGIEATHARRLLRGRDLLRPGVLRHVWLHARLQASAGDSDRRLGDELRRAGARTDFVRPVIRSLERAVRAARWTPRASGWTGYATDNSYGDEARADKEQFVRRVATARRWELVWDLGTNTGAFARLAADHARTVVAIDADHDALDTLYRALASAGDRRILPLLVNLADPSPARGWRGRERRGLVERGRPDLVLCLALLHHLVIAANVPPAEVLAWLADLGGEVVLEHVGFDDPMVRRLLRNRTDRDPDYARPAFERLVAARFTVLHQASIGTGTRTLYHLRPRRDGDA